MHGSVLVIASFAASACVWPTAVAAQVQDARAADSLLTVDQVRGAFTTVGYHADQTQIWDWTSPPVTSFQVHDPLGGRVVMVLGDPAATGRPREPPGQLEDYGDHDRAYGAAQDLWCGRPSRRSAAAPIPAAPEQAT